MGTPRCYWLEGTVEGKLSCPERFRNEQVEVCDVRVNLVIAHELRVLKRRLFYGAVVSA